MLKKKIASVGVLLEELMTEILVRLPVKTLLVCKSISKPWLSLISNPSFIKSHLHFVINKNPTLLEILDPSEANPSNLVLPEILPFNGDMLALPDWLQSVEAVLRSYQRILYAIKTFLHEKGHDFSSLPVCIVMPSVFGNSQVVGTSCCNGIICLSLTDDYCSVVYLWNPSIRRCKQVRVPESYVSRSRNRAKIGFGYDSTSNDYKVFRTSYEKKLDSAQLKMQVYSANADRWREFQGPVLGNKLDEEEKEFQRNNYIVINGTLYFSNGDEQQLITFDLHKEVFGLVSFPSFVQRKWSDILDFKGSVAMVFESVSGIDLWTLDDEVSGQVSSWTKMFSIEADPELNMWLSCYLGAGQFYGNKLMNGNIFVYNVLYDCEKKESMFCGLREDNSLATLKYTETLVSLDGFNQVEENAN